MSSPLATMADSNSRTQKSGVYHIRKRAPVRVELTLAAGQLEWLFSRVDSGHLLPIPAVATEHGCRKESTCVNLVPTAFPQRLNMKV